MLPKGFDIRDLSNFVTYNGRRMARVRGAETAPGQPPAAVQPPASGLGGNGGPPATGFNWGLFPDVPEQMRPTLEPHLRTVQGHVTKLEQQIAPFKPMIERGLTGEQVTGLLNYVDLYEQDPMKVWLDMGTQLQQNGVVHNDLDLEAVTQLATEGDTSVPDPNDPNVQSDEMPPWAQQIQQSVQELSDWRNNETQSRTQQTQQQALKAAIDAVSNQLKEAGYPENLIDRSEIHARIIQHRADLGKVVESMTNYQNGVVKHFTETNTQGGNRDLELPNGAPSTPPRPNRNSGDSWAKARDGATQMLTRANESAAQTGE